MTLEETNIYTETVAQTEECEVKKGFDTISRQALCEYALNQKDKSITPNDIMRFPPARPGSRWIPISKRLPDLDRYSHGENWERKVLITGYLSFDDKKELFVSEAFANDVINYSVHDTVVTAWMPLPDPWRGYDIKK